MLNEVRQKREEVQSEIQRLRERARASSQRSSNNNNNNKAAKQRVEEKEVKREHAGAEDSASGRQKPLLSVSELRVKYAQGKELLKKQKEHREGRKKKSKKRQPKFADLGLIPPLLQAVEAKGWQVPTDIQQRAIKLILRGHNVVCSSQTGTGKTGAFTLPLLQRVHKRKQDDERVGIVRGNGQPLMLAVTPTRELAEQLVTEARALAQHLSPPLNILEIYGGAENQFQVKALKTKNVDILVATPGRLLHYLKQGEAGLDKPEQTVFVEDDESWGDEDDVDDDDEGTEDEADDGDYDDDEEEEEDEEIRESDTLVMPTPKGAKVRSKREQLLAQKMRADHMAAQMPGGASGGAQQYQSPVAPGGLLDLGFVESLVLDECDKMVELGFFPAIKQLYRLLPKPKKILRGGKKKGDMQTCLFSATLSPRIEDVISRFSPKSQLINLNVDLQPPSQVKHLVFPVSNRRKRALLTYFLKRKGSPFMKDQKALIFCRTKQRAERLAQTLEEDGFKALPIHKGLTVTQRRNAIQMFRDGEVQLLCSTEVMARGIDIPDLPFVINFDVPPRGEDYVHRTGRTGRAGNAGTAINLVATAPYTLKLGGRVCEINEQHYLKDIETFLDARSLEIRKVPGPWKDEPIDIAQDPEAQKQKQLREEGVLTLLKRKDLVGKVQDIENNKRLSLYEKMKLKVSIKSALNEKQKSDRRKAGLVDDEDDEAAEEQKTSPAAGRKMMKKKSAGGESLLPSLRNLKEGRYEDLLVEFDKKKARKAGVAVESPDKTEQKRQQRKKLRKAVRHMEQRGLFDGDHKKAH